MKPIHPEPQPSHNSLAIADGESSYSLMTIWERTSYRGHLGNWENGSKIAQISAQHGHSARCTPSVPALPRPAAVPAMAPCHLRLGTRSASAPRTALRLSSVGWGPVRLVSAVWPPVCALGSSGLLVFRAWRLRADGLAWDLAVVFSLLRPPSVSLRAWEDSKPPPPWTMQCSRDTGRDRASLSIVARSVRAGGHHGVVWRVRPSGGLHRLLLLLLLLPSPSSLCLCLSSLIPFVFWLLSVPSPSVPCFR